MVCDKVVCERLCVRVVCERWCVTKSCVSEKTGGGGGGGVRRRRQDTASKTITPHKGVGKNSPPC